MTANHAHTPTTEVVKDAACFPRDRLGEPRGIDTDAFDRWLATVEAAAEQRGAIKALTDFRRFAYRVMPDEVQSKHVIADINIALKRLHNDNHLLMGPLAADQMEGDDA